MKGTIMNSYSPSGPFPEPSDSDSTPVFDATVHTTGADTGALPPGVERFNDYELAPSNESADSSAAQDVAAAAKDGAQSTAAVAKDQAQEVASEVKSQASQLLHTTTSELREQAGAQQKRAAEGLRAVSEQFGAMADSAESGVAGELVSNLSRRTSTVAEWLDERNPGSLLQEVRAFAARRPGAFIAIAAGAGIVTGRLMKSLAASAKDEAAADDITPAR